MLVTELLRFSNASVLALVVICCVKPETPAKASLATSSVASKLLFNLVIESLWDEIFCSADITWLLRELKALESTFVAKSCLAFTIFVLWL